MGFQGCLSIEGGLMHFDTEAGLQEMRKDARLKSAGAEGVASAGALSLEYVM